MAMTGEIANLQNLYTDMQTKMDKEFEHESYTEALTNKDWEWDGNETIVIPTTTHFSLVDYDVTQPWYQRTGSVQQVYDEINSYTVRRKRTFHGEIDEVPSMDQRFIRKMAQALKETVDDELVPENDAYRLGEWAKGAGKVMFGASTTTLAKKGTNDEDIIRTLLTINAKATNLRVPKKDRVFIMSVTDAIETRLSERLQYNQNYSGKMIQGEVAMLGDSKIIAVPDDLMPTGVKIMMKWKGASVDPRKCHKLRTLNNVVGSFSTHAEGLFRYDSFVKAHKANGIIVYAIGTTTTASTEVCEDPKITYDTTNGLVIGAASSHTGVYSGVTYKYVITQAPMYANPKVHEDATTGTGIAYASIPAGTYYVSAYAYKDGCLPSGIVNFKFTKS